MNLVKELKAGSLQVEIYDTRIQMGSAAAAALASAIKELLFTQEFVNIIFAAAPSQNEFLSSLSEQDVAWNKINAFHMDEYIGLPENAPQRFGQFLKAGIFDKVSFNEVFYINGNAGQPEAECLRYAGLLQQYPADIVCMGIGENAHIAFNDPHVADFADPQLVKIVTLDEVSRMQQVHDGCFATLEEVPVNAITLTVPALLKANEIYCIVPGSNKAEAVFHTINSDVNEKYPSTSLRSHHNATLYLDQHSAGKL